MSRRCASSPPITGQVSASRTIRPRLGLRLSSPQETSGWIAWLIGMPNAASTPKNAASATKAAVAPASVSRAEFSFAPAAAKKGRPSANSAPIFRAVGPCQGDQRLETPAHTAKSTRSTSANGLFSITWRKSDGPSAVSPVIAIRSGNPIAPPAAIAGRSAKNTARAKSAGPRAALMSAFFASGATIS